MSFLNQMITLQFLSDMLEVEPMMSSEEEDLIGWLEIIGTALDQ